MITLFGRNAGFYEVNEPALSRIFRPIWAELGTVHEHLAGTLTDTHDPQIRAIADFLLEAPGKRLRPALVLLSAGAAGGAGTGTPESRLASVKIAAAVELIHMASLVHDDLIDDAAVRHHRASVHAQWGKRASVYVGDYLCAKAFRLVADCADPRLFAILGAQLSVTCEGELQQVIGRGDFHLSEHHCLAVTEKKTAALFGACCGAGAATAGGEARVCQALQGYGFHLGVAFQILDDCKDLLSDREQLGKLPGQDWLAGDVTLPLLYAMQHSGRYDELAPARSRHAAEGCELARLGEIFQSSPAPVKIAQLIGSHLEQADRQLGPLVDSEFKESLRQLANHLTASLSGILAR